MSAQIITMSDSTATTSASASEPATPAKADAVVSKDDIKRLEDRFVALLSERKAPVDTRKLEADKAKDEADKLAHDQEYAALRRRVEEAEAARAADKIEASLLRLQSGIEFASPQYAHAGMLNFRAAHKLDVRDGAVLAIGSDGKAQHIANAFASWAKGDGSLFVKSAAQPGPGALASAPPSGAASLKPLKELPDAEFYSIWRSGKLPDGTPIKGRLTPQDRNAPEFTFAVSENPYAAKRATINSAFKGLMARRPQSTV